MCPDNQTLSTYIDGEVEAGLALRIAGHLNACVLCREKLESIHRLRNTLKGLQEPDFEASKIIVWQKIEQATRQGSTPVFWKRKLLIPVPVVMAASALICLLGIGLVFAVAAAQPGFPALVKIESSSVDASVNTLKDLTKYLESHDTVLEVTFQLPAEPSFSLFGQPQFIREADFKRKR
ncbi:MAG: hypothetical protein AB1798_11375 [Spirochaetota bacterium]